MAITHARTPRLIATSTATAPGPDVVILYGDTPRLIATSRNAGLRGSRPELGAQERSGVTRLPRPTCDRLLLPRQSRTSSVRASRTSTCATGPCVKAGVRIGKTSPGLLSRLNVPVQVTRTLAPKLCARS